MKKSEKYSKAAQSEDNDFKSLALHIKALRERKSERFIEDWLPLISQRYTTQLGDNGAYRITTQQYGIVDYFPKANKLLIRKDNQWMPIGLDWIIKHLMN